MAITAPTEGQMIEIPGTGQQGPEVVAQVTYRVRWTCASTPASIDVMWSLLWNDNQVDSNAIPVTWTSGEGEAIAAPVYLPNYSPANAGLNAYKFTATDGMSDCQANVGCNVVVV